MTAIVGYAVRRPSLIALARAVNALLFVATSIYCLLVYSPFSYQQFIKPKVSPAVAGFAFWHSALHWLLLGITALTLAPALERSRARGLGWGYLAACAAVGIWLSIDPVVAQPDPARPNLLYAIVLLVPPIWLSVFDHRSVDMPAPSPSADRRTSAACWIAAALVWTFFAAGVPLRLRLTGGVELTAGRLLLGLAVSAVAHFTAFTFVWIGLAAASGGAALTRSPGRVEYWLLAALSGTVAGAAVMRLVLAPIGIAGVASWIVSAAIGAALAAVWSGIGRHRAAAIAGRPVVTWTALDAWLAPIVTRRSTPNAVLAITVAALAVHVLISRVTTFDWDFMVQKLAALAVWITVFAFVHAIARVGPRRVWIVPVAALLLFVAQAIALPRAAGVGGEARLNPEFALDAYAAADPSYRVIRDALRPGTPGEAAAFYAYLRANSLQQQARIEPAPIDFAADRGAAEGPAPHIFLFIVDSLRPDYLSTHNAAVTFTPRIEAFAADSFAFNRAFTRYAGTGLAVPSIWAGGPLFHKEYVTPFAPMNALQKLLDRRGYRQFIAADHITDELFVPAGDAVPLMRTVTEMQHSFCATVDEMIAALRARPADDRPIFGHARTLDLHIGNIWSARVPPGESYPGFFEPYAARVRAIDQCFGRFITYLKEAALYDESVIVLTSDHGDSLGEEGRWGHGFTIFPEVMRIPLIVRLPDRFRPLEADLSRVSFATDITPTLYELLGEDVQAPGPQFGAPLFVTPGTDMSWRKRESYLVASSYGPTYGLIQDNGRFLYIADATYGRDYAFDLRAGIAGRRIAVTDAERDANRRRIRAEVAAIAARYRFTPRP